MFDTLNPGAIFDTVGWATYAYYNKKEHIATMQKTAMQLSFGWDISAKNYVDVYKSALFYGCGK